jgi:hypothetical protein
MSINKPVIGAGAAYHFFYAPWDLIDRIRLIYLIFNDYQWV